MTKAETMIKDALYTFHTFQKNMSKMYYLLTQREEYNDLSLIVA